MRPFPGFCFLVLSLTLSCQTGVGPVRAAEIHKDVVMKRASFDLNCDISRIEVSEVGPYNYGATGCGKRAVYVLPLGLCHPSNSEERMRAYCQAKLDSESKAR